MTPDTRYDRRRYMRGQAPGEERSLIVSYQRVDGNMVAAKVGFGRTREECLADADSQLRPGVWKRVAISNPASIYSDLLNNGGVCTGSNVRNHKGEGATVTVPAPRVRGGGVPAPRVRGGG